MKTTLKITALLFSLALLTTSCNNKLKGKGPTISQIVPVAGFSKVELDFDADVQYIYSDNYSVTVQAQENVIERMENSVEGEVLELKFRRRTRLVKYDDITVTIYSPEFKGAEVNGSGNVSVTGDFPIQNIDLEISGSGAISVGSVNSSNCSVEISGSGNVSAASGNSRILHTKISGSGAINFSNVEAEKASTVTSGSGNTILWVTESLHVDISGSGNVSYRGTPTVSVDISGSGKLSNI